MMIDLALDYPGGALALGPVSLIWILVILGLYVVHRIFFKDK